MTEKQQLVSGAVALALAALGLFALPQIDGMVGGTILGLLCVLCFVVGTVSIGTSEQLQV